MSNLVLFVFVLPYILSSVGVPAIFLLLCCRSYLNSWVSMRGLFRLVPSSLIDWRVPGCGAVGIDECLDVGT